MTPCLTCEPCRPDKAGEKLQLRAAFNRSNVQRIDKLKYTYTPAPLGTLTSSVLRRLVILVESRLGMTWRRIAPAMTGGATPDSEAGLWL